MNPLRSKPLLLVLAFATLRWTVGGVPAAHAADKRNADFAQVLPAGTTAGVLVVDNFFKTATFDENSPVAKLLAQPAVKIWTKNLLPKQLPVQEMLDTFGLTAKDLPRLFSGKAALAAMLKKAGDDKDGAVGTDKGKDGDGGDMNSFIASMEFDGLALVEFLGSAAEFEDLAGKLEADIRKDAPKADIKRERVDGVTLRSMEIDTPIGGETKPRTFFLALYNDTIIFATSRAQLLDMINGFSRTVIENPLSGRSDYIAAKKEMGTNDGFFFGNFTTLMPWVRGLLIRSFEESTKGNPMAKSMIDPKTVVDALAPEEFTSVYGSLTITEQQVEARYGLTWKDQVGLAKLIQFGRTPVSLPAYASADYKGVDVSTADYPAIWDAADGMVRTAFPAAYPMIGMSIATNPKVQDLMTKLRKGVLDNLEQEMVSLTGFPTASPADDETPGKVVVLRVKDPAAAQTAIEALAERMGELQGKPGVKPDMKEYLGTKIYGFPLPPGMFPTPPPAADDADEGDDDDGKKDDDDNKSADKSDDKPDDKDSAEPDKAPEPTSLSYAFVDNRLIISAGADSFIRGVIANLQKPGRPLADGKFKDELGDLPGTPCSIAYGDVATYLMALLNENLRTGSYKTTKLSHADLIKARDEAKGLHYFWAGKSYYSAGGFFGRLVIAEDKPSN